MSNKTKISQHDLSRARNRVRKWRASPFDTPLCRDLMNARAEGSPVGKLQHEIGAKRYARAMALIAYHKLGEDV
jgi:hypothetical protein